MGPAGWIALLVVVGVVVFVVWWCCSKRRSVSSPARWPCCLKRGASTEPGAWSWSALHAAVAQGDGPGVPVTGAGAHCGRSGIGRRAGRQDRCAAPAPPRRQGVRHIELHRALPARPQPGSSLSTTSSVPKASGRRCATRRRSLDRRGGANVSIDDAFGDRFTALGKRMEQALGEALGGIGFQPDDVQPSRDRPR